MALTNKQCAELRMKFGGRCAYCDASCQKKGGTPTTLKPLCTNGNSVSISQMELAAQLLIYDEE